MTDYMKNLGARMVDGGYHILPIAPARKYPAEYCIGGWRPMFRWDRYATRQPTELELAHWATWPGAGIGVVCGRTVVGIDIDFLNAQDAYRARQIAYDQLGFTPACRVGLAPKCLLVYRVSQDIASVSIGKLDILGTGCQFVSYGNHPVTRKSYDWPDEALADLPLSALPDVTAAQVEGFTSAMIKAFPNKCSEVRSLSPRPLTAKGMEALTGDVDAIKSALRQVPNPDLPYNEWMRVGMALKGALGETGEDLFHDWSAHSSKYVVKATAKAWLSFRPDRIGAGTIFYIANANGWRRASLDDSTHPARKLFQEYR